MLLAVYCFWKFCCEIKIPGDLEIPGNIRASSPESLFRVRDPAFELLCQV